MAVSGGGSATVPSLPPPRPKSPPEYPDLYGKRRETARIQMLEREIGFLEEDLKSAQVLQPASRCCKEVTEFVMENSDPLIPTYLKNRRSCRFWKWLCKMSCFSCSWICCNWCSLQLELPNCCGCNLCNCHSCVCCTLPKCRCQCCCWPRFRCLKKTSCCRSCICQCPSCPDCSCITWKCSCPTPRCPKVSHCCYCTKSCCNPCSLCY